MINERLSFIQWETLVAQVANIINDLPLALGNIVSDFESMDLLTPNRLKLGRNNDRAPVFPVETASLQRIIEQNKKIFQTWFSVWLVSHVPKLMEQPKWYTTERDLKICDIVLMLKHEGNRMYISIRHGPSNTKEKLKLSIEIVQRITIDILGDLLDSW